MPDWAENKLYVMGSTELKHRFHQTLLDARKTCHQQSYGQCKYYNHDKGYGFIKPNYSSNDDRDIFFTALK